MDHFALRPQNRGGLLGTGTAGRGGREGDERVKARPRIPPEKDRRDRGPPPQQWKCNGGVPRHCPATSALRNCCFNCRAWAESQGQCPLHCCWATTWSERSPTFAAQLHLPTHDLFWPNSKVQLHLPPLDLLIFWSRLEPCWPRSRTHAFKTSLMSQTLLPSDQQAQPNIESPTMDHFYWQVTAGHEIESEVRFCIAWGQSY